jgi:hypothetical protein
MERVFAHTSPQCYQSVKHALSVHVSLTAQLIFDQTRQLQTVSV